MSEIVMIKAGTTYPLSFDSAPQKALWRYARKIKGYMGITRTISHNLEVKALGKKRTQYVYC